MNPQLLTYLFEFIKYKDWVIKTLQTLLIGKGMFDKHEEKPISKPYLKLQVNELPLLKRFIFRSLKTNIWKKNGKLLKPVCRHFNAKVKISNHLNVPKCGAPSQFVNTNNGEKGLRDFSITRIVI